MAAAIDVGIRVTPPYGKSGKAGQMRLRDAAMRAGCPVRRRCLHPPKKGRVKRILCSVVGRSATAAIALGYVAVTAGLVGVIGPVIPVGPVVRMVMWWIPVRIAAAVTAIAGLGRRLRWLRLRIGGAAAVGIDRLLPV